MKQTMLMLACLMLMASTCRKDEECHSNIKFENQSEQEVIFALLFTDIEGKCVLSGEKVMRNDICNFRPYNSCIENNLSNDNPLDIYIIDIDKYNNPVLFYDCDSVPIKNRILKQYSLTLDDLKQNDFTLTYP